MGEDQVAAGQQCNHHRHAEDEFQSGPEHAHELDQAKSAGNVLAVELLEEANLRLLAGKGSDQARARIIFLGLRGDVGKAGLDALEAVVDSGSEVLNEDAGDGHGRQRDQGQIRADAEHEEQRADGEENGIGGVHEGWAEQHAHCLQVVGHAGHDVAGAVTLIEARVLLFQVDEEVVAQVELDLARDADENPSLGVKKDAFDQRDSHQQPGEEQNPVASDPVAHPVDGLFQHLGKEHPNGIGGNARETAPHVSPAVAAHIDEERAQIAKHGFIVRGKVKEGRSRCWPHPFRCGAEVTSRSARAGRRRSSVWALQASAGPAAWARCRAASRHCGGGSGGHLLRHR